MADYIKREVVLNRIATLMKRITPIEDSRDMFFHDSGVNGAITGAILEVKNTPAADVVSMGVLQQVMWERDIAISQLESYGVGFAEEADVAKVMHGKWIKHRDEYDCEYIECSVCGEEYYPPENAFEFDTMPKYCQECGAKIDGRSDSDG